MKRLICSIILVLFTFIGLSAQIFTYEEMQTHLKIINMTESEAPHIWNNQLVLSYFEDRLIRIVGISFEHEGFRKVHQMTRNEQGVFFLMVPLPDEKTIHYRIVVDGLWTTDPKNPLVYRDRKGIPLSEVILPEELVKSRMKMTRISDKTEGITRFLLQTLPGQNVALMGDFNRWDPYMNSLQEVSPGSYLLDLKLNPGRYAYYFMVNGRVVLDKQNPEQALSMGGERASIVSVQ